jgi:hypothetical protein
MKFVRRLSGVRDLCRLAGGSQTQSAKCGSVMYSVAVLCVVGSIGRFTRTSSSTRRVRAGQDR